MVRLASRCEGHTDYCAEAGLFETLKDESLTYFMFSVLIRHKTVLMVGELEGGWIHVYVWRSHSAVLLKLSQHCYLAIPKNKIKSGKKKKKLY